MKAAAGKNICLVGTGLIGASLGLALSRLPFVRPIVGFDASVRHLRVALKAGAITARGRDIRRELGQSGLVILALPVSSLRGWMRRHAGYVPSNSLVIDVGSVKTGIVTDARKFFPAGNFVACHPMAGSEKTGPVTARDELFAGKTCFIARQGSAGWAFQRARRLWRSIGAKPVMIAPAAHDRLTARISHLPQAVAVALAAALLRWDRAGAVSRHAAGGSKDTTRIAAGSSSMWRDIFMENSANVLPAITAFRTSLMRLENLIRRGDSVNLEKFLRRAGEWRRKL